MSEPPHISEELIELKAHQIWQKRQLGGEEGTSQSDWEEAKQYLEEHRWGVLWWNFRKVLNKTWKLIRNTIKLLIFPFCILWKFLLREFKRLITFFWKTLPTSDWIKLLAAPVALSIAGAWITTRFQEENRQNETINKYFEQIEKLVVDKKIDFSRLDYSVKALIKGRTLATLRSIDVERQKIIISFLSETNLLNYPENGISLSYFNLSQNKFLGLFNKTGINLSGFNLEGINLKQTTLFKANLEGANLEGANLEGANLNRANLEGANLKSAKLYQANLRDADLGGANLEDANLFLADLLGAKFLDADLRGANLREIKFDSQTKLEGALFDLSTILPFDKEEAKQEYRMLEIAPGADLQESDLKGVNLQKANLSKANLQDADLREANLQGANLREADLQNADLVGVNLQRTDLIRANLQKANLIWANFQGANLFGANLQGAGLIQANLQGAILVDTENLTFKQIKSTCFWYRAIYKGQWDEERRTWIVIESDNTNFIEKLSNDIASDPDEPIDCSLWEKEN